MNKNKIFKYQIFSIIFVFILGTLLHFTYRWSDGNKIIALFSSVNESTWEHLKLIYFPMLITTIIGYFYLAKTYPNFLCAKTIGIIVAVSFTVIFFYTYTGIIGKNIEIIDVLTFYISVFIGEYIFYIFIKNKFKCNDKYSIIVLMFFFISFIIFTYKTPNLGIFKDPITKKFRNINFKY